MSGDKKDILLLESENNNVNVTSFSNTNPDLTWIGDGSKMKVVNSQNNNLVGSMTTTTSTFDEESNNNTDESSSMLAPRNHNNSNQNGNNSGGTSPVRKTTVIFSSSVINKQPMKSLPLPLPPKYLETDLDEVEYTGDVLDNRNINKGGTMYLETSIDDDGDVEIGQTGMSDKESKSGSFSSHAISAGSSGSDKHIDRLSFPGAGGDTHGHTRLVIKAEKVQKPTVKFANVVDASKLGKPSVHTVQPSQRVVSDNTTGIETILDKTDRANMESENNITYIPRVDNESESEGDYISSSSSSSSGDDSSSLNDNRIFIEETLIGQDSDLNSCSSVHVDGNDNVTGDNVIPLNINPQESCDTYTSDTSKTSASPQNCDIINTIQISDLSVPQKDVKRVNFEKKKIDFTEDIKQQASDSSSRHKPLKRLALKNGKDSVNDKKSTDSHSTSGTSLGIKRFKFSKMSSLFGQKSKSEQNISLYKEDLSAPQSKMSRSRDCILMSPTESERTELDSFVVSEQASEITKAFTLSQDTKSTSDQVQKSNNTQYGELGVIEHSTDIVNKSQVGLIEENLCSDNQDELIQQHEVVVEVYKNIIEHSVSVEDNVEMGQICHVERDVVGEIEYAQEAENCAIVCDDRIQDKQEILMGVNTQKNLTEKLSEDKIVNNVASGKSDTSNLVTQNVDTVMETIVEGRDSPTDPKPDITKTGSCIDKEERDSPINPTLVITKTESHKVNKNKIGERLILKSAEVNEYMYEDTLEILEEVDISDSLGSLDHSRTFSNSDINDDEESSIPDSTSEGSFTLDDAPISHVQPEHLAYVQVQLLPPVVEDVYNECLEEEEEEELRNTPEKPLGDESTHVLVNKNVISANDKLVKTSYENGVSFGIDKAGFVKKTGSSNKNNDNNYVVDKNMNTESVITQSIENEMILDIVSNTRQVNVNTIENSNNSSESNRYQEEQILKAIHRQVEEKLKRQDLENENRDVLSRKPRQEVNNVKNTGSATDECDIEGRGSEGSGVFRQIVLDNNTHLVVEVSEDSAFEDIINTHSSPGAYSDTQLSPRQNLHSQPVSPEGINEISKTRKSNSTEREVSSQLSQNETVSNLSQKIIDNSNDRLVLNESFSSQSSVQTSHSRNSSERERKPSALELKIGEINQKYAKQPKIHRYESQYSTEETKPKSAPISPRSDNNEYELQYTKRLREMSIEGDYQQIEQYQNRQNSSTHSTSESSSTISTHSTSRSYDGMLNHFSTSPDVIINTQPTSNLLNNNHRNKELHHYSSKYDNYKCHQPSVASDTGSNPRTESSSHDRLSTAVSSGNVSSSSGHTQTSREHLNVDLLLTDIPLTHDHHNRHHHMKYHHGKVVSTTTTTSELQSHKKQQDKEHILGEFSLEDEVFRELHSNEKFIKKRNQELQKKDFLTVINSCEKPLVTKSLSQLPWSSGGKPNKQKFAHPLTSQLSEYSNHRLSLTDLNENGEEMCLTMEVDDPEMSYSQLTIGRRSERLSSSGSGGGGSGDRARGGGKKNSAMYKTLEKMRSNLGKPLEGPPPKVNRYGSGDIVHHTPRFVRDTSKLWYKPHISRDEAITLLRERCAGSFVVRDSNSFPGAFGLAVKVAQVPPNVPTKGGDPQAELVRHFLIEPTSKGVKLKGCSNEPVFASLAALVYQHSITPLALPCKLLLPEGAEQSLDTVDAGVVTAGTLTSTTILAQGAACNVLFIYTADMESLTGPEAVAKAIKEALSKKPPTKTTVVHFKVSSQGITLTDNKRRLFFRRHYAVNTVTFCGMDPEDRKWTHNHEDTGLPMNAKVFGFVARKSGGSLENQCHLFAELDPDQPATAIVNFVTKVMIGQGRIMRT